ncbi:MAG: right-handed parallel beta-helix repeat-containing protein, partial [Candidatus Thorarchaeota archaeon]|nr:right-handed parallel beta-helix repeat-containing protein [Candidatus Thorarchaeota archaeon]
MRKIIILATCVVALLCIPVIPLGDVTEDTVIPRTIESTPAQFGPIVITSNSEMINAGLDGAGTLEDPYRIYSFYIPTDGTHGIWVSNVDLYFRIWDCTISGSPHLGIGIRNCQFVNISDCAVTGAEYGISIVDSPIAFVEDCQVTVVDDGIGLTLDNVLLATISGCTFSGGETGSEVIDSIVFFDGNSFIENNNGILGEPITNCFITSNSFENCTSYGIRFEDYSRACTIVGNTFSGFYTGGILLRYSENMSIVGNNFTHCGLTVIGVGIADYDHYVEGNLVNLKPLLYLIGTDDVHYSGDDYGQIYLVDCNHITITGGLITSTQRGVFTAYSTECVVQDMMITACQAGVTLGHSRYITIRNCTIRSCSTGVLFWGNSENNSLTYNQISYSFNQGILINPDSRWNFFVNNSFHHNDDGLLDNGSENDWDDGEQFGNFYDDYSGYGNYTIPGTANSVDNYPDRYVPTSSGGIQTPVEVTLIVGLGIMATGVIIV